MFDLSVVPNIDANGADQRRISIKAKNRRNEEGKPFAICALLYCQMRVFVVVVVVALEYEIDIKLVHIVRAAEVSIAPIFDLWVDMWKAITHPDTHTRAHQRCEMPTTINRIRQTPAHQYAVLFRRSRIQPLFFSYVFIVNRRRHRHYRGRWAFSPSPSKAARYINRCGHHNKACVLCGLVFQFYTCSGFRSTESPNRAQFI